MNEIFRKTAAAVSHPVFLLALILLFLNDHVFRVLHPSWLTGILGDFAWLFIAPLALLLVLSGCIHRVSRGLPLVSYGLVGGLYVLGNTWPAFLGWLGGMVEQILGSPVNMVSDMGDLLALPALAASYLFWKQVKWIPQPGLLRKYGAVSGAVLTALLTVANMSAPDYGVSGLIVEDGVITTCSAYVNQESRDGGLTWTPAEVNYSGGCGFDWDGTLVIQQNGAEVSLRYNEGDHLIERSVDGLNWQPEYSLQPANQAGQALYVKETTGNVIMTRGILDAVYDPSTGNTVFALGLDGVLVRTAGGNWQQVAVGEFGPRRVNTLHDFSALLGGEASLAVLLGLLMLATLGVKFTRAFGFLLPLGIGWLGWIAVSLFQPALYDNYPIPILIPLGLSALFIVPVAVYAFTRLIRQPRRSVLLGLSIAFDAVVLYLGTFVVWAFNIIQQYRFAMWFAYAWVLIDVIVLFLIIPASREDKDKENPLMA